jgi:hypothetical protein
VEKKVTVFGESAGALSTSYHYLNENFTAVARAAVRTCLSDKVTPLNSRNDHLDLHVGDGICPSYFRPLPRNSFLDALCTKYTVLRDALAITKQHIFLSYVCQLI